MDRKSTDVSKTITKGDACKKRMLFRRTESALLRIDSEVFWLIMFIPTVKSIKGGELVSNAASIKFAVTDSKVITDFPCSFWQSSKNIKTCTRSDWRGRSLEIVGSEDGMCVGEVEGRGEDSLEGSFEGRSEGESGERLGLKEGPCDGAEESITVGDSEASSDGEKLGIRVVGIIVGESVISADGGSVGADVGLFVGLAVVFAIGESVGGSVSVGSTGDATGGSVSGAVVGDWAVLGFNKTRNKHAHRIHDRAVMPLRRDLFLTTAID